MRVKRGEHNQFYYALRSQAKIIFVARYMQTLSRQLKGRAKETTG